MRGVSYPPPSPRGLTRAQPVPQSRNPPLVKTRRLTSVVASSNVSTMVGDLHQSSASGEATGLNTNIDATGALLTNSKTRPASIAPHRSMVFSNVTFCRDPDGPSTATPEIVTESFDVNEVEAELDDELADAEYDEARQQLLNAALAKRLGRNERLDNRRYHTAGAIEDIKVSWTDFGLNPVYINKY